MMNRLYIPLCEIFREPILFKNVLKKVIKVRKCSNKIDSHKYFHHMIDSTVFKQHIQEYPSDLSYIDKYINHQFNLLGSGWVSSNYNAPVQGFEGHIYKMQSSPPILSQCSKEYIPIDWQKEMKTGFRFDVTKTSKHMFSDLPIGVDIKMPWELARMYHLPQIAIASLYSENKNIYITEVIDEIYDFCVNNPVGYGVNWSCTMEVAIRIINMLIAVDIITDIFKVPEKFLTYFTNCVLEHGQYIVDNLEKNYRTGKSGNHYLANLLGLLFVGAYVKTTKTRTWFEFASREYKREISKQYFWNGGIYEFSTAYHRLDSEITALAVALIIRAKLKLDDCVLYKLSRSLDFLIDITGNDERIIQIGDNDNGRIVMLLPDCFNEYGNELSSKPAQAMLKSVFGKRETRNVYSLLVSQLALGLWIPYKCIKQDVNLKKNQYNKKVNWKEILHTKISVGRMKFDEFSFYPEFGLVVFKGSRNQLIVRTPTDISKGITAHAHNDFMHFEFIIQGKRYFADQGSYIYTADVSQRMLFRSSKAHNVPIYQKEQHKNSGCWKMVPVSIGKVTEINNTTITMIMRNKGIIHSREICFLEDGLEIIDKSNASFIYKCKNFVFESVGYGFKKSIIHQAIPFNISTRKE